MPLLQLILISRTLRDSHSVVSEVENDVPDDEMDEDEMDDNGDDGYDDGDGDGDDDDIARVESGEMDDSTLTLDPITGAVLKDGVSIKMRLVGCASFIVLGANYHVSFIHPHHLSL